MNILRRVGMAIGGTTVVALVKTSATSARKIERTCPIRYEYGDIQPPKMQG